MREDWRDDYLARVAQLQRSYAAIPAGTPIRLSKPTSNLFRPRAASAHPGLDVTSFDGVMHIDREARIAEVQGMTTYEHLVAATLPYGLAPMCVPQLKTITLGGAVTGMGIESASFRSGTPHESVIEMDILTGAGEVITVSGKPDDPHRDLFFGFANSYGSLGYALRLQIELEPVKQYVHLRHIPFVDAKSMQNSITPTTASAWTSLMARCSARTSSTSPSARWSTHRPPICAAPATTQAWTSTTDPSNIAKKTY